MKKIFALLALLATTSAFAANPTGTVSIQGLGLGKAAMIVLDGDASKAIWDHETAMAVYPDSNGLEHEKAGDGIVCRQIDASLKVICIIDFSDITQGQLEHN